MIEAEFELNDDDGSAYEKMTDYNKRRREKAAHKPSQCRQRIQSGLKATLQAH